MSTEHVEKFLIYAQKDRERSTHTIRRYEAVLGQLEEYCDPITADVEQVQAWWESRYGYSKGTRNNDLACVRSFYKWATKFDHRPDDPSRRLDAVSNNRRAPRPIGKADADKLLGPLTEDALDLRRAFALGLYAGLRVSEAAGLDWSDVNIDERLIYVMGKGEKERIAPLNAPLWDLIAPEVVGNVVMAGGRPISGATLQRKANRFMERHGIGHSYHDLRKRGATMALARGGNPEAVRKVYGWASMNTVSYYADIGTEEVHKIGELMM